MKKPLRKDFPSHQAWVAAMDEFNAARPKRKDYKSHAAWLAAVDLFNKNSKPTVKKKVVKTSGYSKNLNKGPVIKSINKTDYNVSTVEGKKAYEKALENSKKQNNNNNESKDTTSNSEGKTQNKQGQPKTNEKKYKQVTQKELDAKIEEIKNKKVKKKESKYIRNPKTKTLVRRTSHKGKQLLKIQARIDARNKRLFGDKKKKKS